MAHTLPPLPYPKDALAPHMSAETLDYHHGKHHNAYVTKLNSFIEQDPSLADKSLEDLIRTTKGGVFNNAAQVWNHTFFWNCLSPKGGGEPSGALGDAIRQKWGSFDAFKKAFKDAALGQFGSGWAWLVSDGGSVEIVTTGNAENPMTQGKTPLLTCDVWEHAYYIDYRNDRGSFVDHFFALANWDFAANNFAG